MTSIFPDRERTSFHSLNAGGLDWDSFPLRLFVKGNALQWNPADIDFSRDAEDWAGLGEVERRLATTLSAMFIAEQNVALLEGKVDRIIGMHAGKLKGEASSSFRLSGSH